MKASFSPNGQCLILGSSEGIYSIVRLGPLLGIDLVPLDMHGGVEQLPPWALKEVLFRTGDGPSFIQRHSKYLGCPRRLCHLVALTADKFAFLFPQQCEKETKTIC